MPCLTVFVWVDVWIQCPRDAACLTSHGRLFHTEIITETSPKRPYPHNDQDMFFCEVIVKRFEWMSRFLLKQVISESLLYVRLRFNLFLLQSPAWLVLLVQAHWQSRTVVWASRLVSFLSPFKGIPRSFSCTLLTLLRQHYVTWGQNWNSLELPSIDSERTNDTNSHEKEFIEKFYSKTIRNFAFKRQTLFSHTKPYNLYYRDAQCKSL